MLLVFLLILGLAALGWILWTFRRREIRHLESKVSDTMSEALKKELDGELAQSLARRKKFEKILNDKSRVGSSESAPKVSVNELSPTKENETL